jgi:hypothetical protein
MENPIYIIAKDFFTFIFTLAGLIIAWVGLATWKKQIKGSKNFEMAYNFHYSMLKLRNAIEYVRNPAIFPSENNKAIQYSKDKYPEKPEEEIKKDSNLYVYEMRWEKINNALKEMESHLLAIEVLWGPEILTLIKPLNRKIIELNSALKQMFGPPEYRVKKLDELYGIIYDKSNWINGEKDPFNKEISQIIEKITNYIKNKIS